MDAYLAILLFFGAFIGLGIAISVTLYNFDAIGRPRIRYRRRSLPLEPVLVEYAGDESEEDEALEEVS